MGFKIDSFDIKDNLINNTFSITLNTPQEVEVVKEQYLDMTNDNDRLFYQYLLGNIID